MKKILSLLLAAILAFTIIPVNATAIANEHTMVSIPWNLINKCGHQAVSGPCQAYCWAYCRIILDNQSHNYSEYWTGTMAKAPSVAGYTSQSAKMTSKQILLETICNNVDLGRPVVVRVKGSKAFHYVVAVGYKTNCNRNNLEESDILILDPVNKAINVLAGEKETYTYLSSCTLSRAADGCYGCWTTTSGGTGTVTAPNNGVAENVSNPGVSSSYFTIKNLGSSKMLNVKGNSSKSNTNVTVYQADGTTGQNFQLVADSSGGYVINPQCAPTCVLNVYGQSSADGLNVNIWTKSGNSTQSWVIEYNRSLSGYVIRSANNTNYVLTATGSGNSSNVQLAQFDPANTYQVWTSEAFSAISAPTISEPSNPSPAPPSSESSPIESTENAGSSITPQTGSYFTIKNLGSDKMLNVKGNSDKSNTNVTIYQADGTTGQNFQFLADGNGHYVLQPQCAPSCALNVYGQYAAAGFNVNIWTKSGNSTQSWTIEHTSAGDGYLIRSADNPSYVLAASGSGNSSNVELQQYDAGNAYQVWTSAAFSAATPPASPAPDNSPNNEPANNTVSVRLDTYFTVKNLGSDKMLNVKGNSSKSNTNVTVYQADGTTGQNFLFIDNGADGYVIEPQCAPACALNVYGQYSADGFNVTTWTKSGNSTQAWIIEHNSSLGGYVIRSADNTDYVLTAAGSGNSSNVQLGKYDPANTYQIWISDAFQY